MKKTVQSIRSPRFPLRALFWLVLATAFLLPSFVVLANQPTEPPSIFLPVVEKGNKSTSTPPTQPPPTQPPPTQPPPTQPPPTNVPARKALFVYQDKKTGSASMARDSQGGLHAAYADYVPYVDHPQAVYMYCSNGAGVDCGKLNSWSGAGLGDNVNEVQLALTPDGKPRLLFTAQSDRTNYDKDYFYAACDSNCTVPGQWDVTYVLSSAGTAVLIMDTAAREAPQRYFSLDPQGRPRFIYFDRNYHIEPDHYGAFYVWCDAACTSHTPDNPTWFEARITYEKWEGYSYDYEILEWPSLTFTSEGHPRVVGSLFSLMGPDGVYYMACDSGCENIENWERAFLYDRASMVNVGWDIEVDAQDRPRVAQYYGDTIDETGDQLIYHWCDANCTDQNQWKRVLLGDAGLGTYNGHDPDLELDAQGRPYIAAMHNGGSALGFLYCYENCNTDNANWWYELIDTAELMEHDFPVARPPHCDAGTWTSYTPVMALDPDGNPHVAFDAKYVARCWYDPNPNDNIPPESKIQEVWHAVRIVQAPKPQPE